MKISKIISVRHADKVSIGDELLVQGNNGLVPGNVFNISNFMMQGYIHRYLVIHIEIGFTLKFSQFKQMKNSFFFLGSYTPLNMEGSIIVDGVLASCYTFSDQDLAHFSLLPIQSFPQIMVWIFGEDNESPGYVDVLENLGKLMLPY